ncbi:MAG: hypothetical protein JXB24_08340 [Bacteroidales bacterium]|nr:hypothetical protein [Bacteroidales bacterium]
MHTCWFCDTLSATHQFKVFLPRETGKQITGLEKKISFHNLTVPIPRCDLCASVHLFRNRCNKVLIAVFLTNMLLLMALFGTINPHLQNFLDQHNRVMFAILFVLLFFSPGIISLIIGTISRGKIEIKKWAELTNIGHIKSINESS